MRMSLRASFDVLLAADGAEALDLFMKKGADAVVLDGSMPRLSGYEACARIRALPQGRDVPVCIVTSSDEGQSIERAFEAGANDFFLKPVHLGVLARKLLALIKQRGDVPATSSHEDVVFDALPIPAALVDGGGRVIRVNRSFARQFRTAPQPGDTWFTFYAPGGGMSEDTADGSFHALLEGKRFNLTLSALPPGLGANRLLLAVESPDAPHPHPFTSHGPAAPSAHILILEDQELVQRSILRLLARADHRIAVTGNADEAVSAFKYAYSNGDPFDLVLLDLSIPGSLGGADVLRSIRVIDSGVKAIATSGSWDDPVMSHPAAHGFDGVLPKPYNREELLTKIREVLLS